MTHRDIVGRRRVLGRALGALSLVTVARPVFGQGADTALAAQWQDWQQQWREMAALASRRGWPVAGPLFDPPASEADIDDLELRQKVTVPPQLRAILTQCAARVAFAWFIPPHLVPLEKVRTPTSGGMRGTIWDLDHIDRYAITNFRSARRELADKRISEAPNTPAMWEHQFPFGYLNNGDLLTIDVASAEEPHPVRYFSQDLEGLHGLVIAEDFASFVSEYTKLGGAGDTQDDWFSFVVAADSEHHLLRADSSGGRRWRAWLDRAPTDIGPNEPPQAIVARSATDMRLLKAAKRNDIAGVMAALDAGAVIDCITPDRRALISSVLYVARARDDALTVRRLNHRYEDEPYLSPRDEFMTALLHAVRHRNIAMAELLARRGATINTRRLALIEAAAPQSSDVALWLISHGARVNGWTDALTWPLHAVVLAGLRAAPTARSGYYGVLAAMLDAGADPNARMADGSTMVMKGDLRTAQMLVAHGADISLRDGMGMAAIHHVTTGAIARLLVAHGADVNDLSKSEHNYPNIVSATPLQWVLLYAHGRDPTLLPDLLALGADPRKRAGDGRNSLSFCVTIADFQQMLGFDLDPLERLPDGSTLLQKAATNLSFRIAAKDQVAFFTYLLQFGIDINATDQKGRTLLHLMASGEMTQPDDIRFALDHGADKALRDAAGQRAYDIVAPSKTALRALLQ